MNNEVLSKHWKAVLIFLSFSILLVLVYYAYHQAKYVPIAQITNVSPASIADGQKAIGRFNSIADVEEVSDLINKRVTKPADQIFYTSSQQEADSKANQLAKHDGADYLLKETKSIPSNNNTNGSVPTTSTNTTAGQQATVENKYYAVTQERQNAIGAGVTVADGKVYSSISAEHTFDKNKHISAEVIAHTKDFKTIDGATVMVKKRF